MAVKKYVIRCYCVIIYVGHFWPPNLFTSSVQSLLYKPKYLLLCQYIYFCLILFWKGKWLVPHRLSLVRIQ